MENRIRQLGEEPTTLLAFAKAELQNLEWEHDAEFKFNGDMYDVVHSYEVGDSVFYECWKDHEEMQLKRNLFRFVAQQYPKTPMQQNAESRIFDLLKSLVVMTSPRSGWVTDFGAHTQAKNSEAYFYQKDRNSPPSPPPKI